MKNLTFNCILKSILIISSLSLTGPLTSKAQDCDSAQTAVTIFSEDWSSGQFGYNGWMAGENWAMDHQSGNPEPTAVFQGTPQLLYYSGTLVSYWLDAATLDPTVVHTIWLDFDLELEDTGPGMSESLTVDVFDGTSWVAVSAFYDTLSPGWKKIHTDITGHADLRVFRIRFRASGDNSSAIQSWKVDNISVYCVYELNPPTQFDAHDIYTNGPILLSWQPPDGYSHNTTFVLDDNSAENGWAINPGYESWLGNEFADAGTGTLSEVMIWFQSNSSSSDEALTLDIFDADRNLVVSSEPFVPMDDNWQTIDLGDVPFSGTFYAMLRWNMLTGQTNYLGSDENGPNAQSDLGWYYDGTAWAHLSDFGYAPCVFLIRVHAWVEGDGQGKPFTGREEPTEARTIRQVDNAGGSLSMKRPDRPDTVPFLVRVNAPATDSLIINFNIYRCEYVDPSPGGYTNWTDWELLTTTSATEYIDSSSYYLNCHIYRVTAVYSMGESDPTPIEMICFYSGMQNTEAKELMVYPVPAFGQVHVGNGDDFDRMCIFDSYGVMKKEVLTGGCSDLVLDIGGLPPGIYFIRFMSKGKVEAIRKLLIARQD